MKQTGDQHFVKRMNKRIVLETVKQYAPISRAEISARTGLNKATVSSLVSELIAEQLILETGLGRSSGGRKPVMLLFNEKAGYATGMDIGIDHLLSVITDLSGKVIYESSHPISDRSSENVIRQLVAIYEELHALTPPSPYGIVGLGIGAPGIVDSQGNVCNAPHLQWKNVALKKLVSERIDHPVIVDNEANTGALGELLFDAKEMSTCPVIYISAGKGIGTGMILDGKLYRGATGFSGEMGHMTIRENGERCPCGNRGCWELYASENALLKLASKTFTESSPVTFQSLLEKARNGNTDAILCFQQIGHDLGVGLINIVNTFNPEKIIIGNQLSLAAKFIHKAAQDVLQARSLHSHYNDVKISFSKLGLKASAVGAASLALHHFFDARDEMP